MIIKGYLRPNGEITRAYLTFDKFCCFGSWQSLEQENKDLLHIFCHWLAVDIIIKQKYTRLFKIIVILLEQRLAVLRGLTV